MGLEVTQHRALVNSLQLEARRSGPLTAPRALQVATILCSPRGLSGLCHLITFTPCA